MAKPERAAAVDPARLRARLIEAIGHHQRGELATAIAGYEQVLAAQPQQFDALRLLGAALRAQGRHAEAVDLFDRALAVRGDFAEVLELRGKSLMTLGRRAEAAQSLEQSLRARPGDAETWALLGDLWRALDRNDEALAAFDRSLAIAPDMASVWNNRALALDAMKRPVDALADYERAIAIDPRVAEIWCNRSKVLADLGRNEEALASLDESLRLAPDFVAAWNSRAAPLRALSRLSEALESTDHALQLDPGFAPAWSQRGALLSELSRFDEAMTSYERSLALAPDERTVRWNLGLLRLSLGDYARGWEGYEARQDMDTILGRLDIPVWDGSEDLAGRTIALHCEQGLGDTLQFCRFAPVLAGRGARVILTVPRVLYRLACSLARDNVALQVLTDGDPLPAVDYQCLLISLPHRLRTRLDTIPDRVPYLRAPASALARWRQRLGLVRADGSTPSLACPRIGLAVSGSAGPGTNQFRAITLEALAGVIRAAGGALAGVEWHFVQKDLRAADAPWLERLGIVDHRDALEDFADTAALVSCMDAVVSIDTSVAHLAGALGVPVYVLLSANADWRWLVGREDSPWYPSARLLRQQTLGDWGPVLQQLAPALTPLLDAVRTKSLPPRPAELQPDWQDDAMLSGFLEAVRAAPASAPARFNLGLRLLALGQLDAGWDHHEWRQWVPGLHTSMPDGGHYWDGSRDIAGRTLLVCQEQGLGDCIQFARYVPLLAARGARVLLGVAPPLARLMAGLPGTAQVLSGAQAVPAFDYKCLVMSLGQRFGTTLATVPADIPYLAVPPERMAAWRARLDATREAGSAPPWRVGIACSGNPAHPLDAQRSVPLARFAALRAALDVVPAGCPVEFHLVQDRVRPADAEALAMLGVHDHGAALVDLAETAALIACLDVVVSVDTAVAHLAGALGVPLALLLPAEPDWRWLLGREDSPWYPGARLFRCARDDGDPWGDVLRQAGAHVLALHRTAQRRRGEPAQLGLDLGQAPAVRLAEAAPANFRRSNVVPPDLHAMLRAAIARHRGGHGADAIAAYREILALGPAYFDARRLLGAALLEEGQAEAASGELEQALALEPGSQEVGRLLGECRRLLGAAAAASPVHTPQGEGHRVS